MANKPRVDCHAHIIAPARFPYADGPGYRPRADETGDAEMFATVLAAHGVTHALLVQPSCYGDDNSAMLDAMGQSHGRYRGIAVVSPRSTDNELLTLKRQGIVGVRLHLVRSSPDALSRTDAPTFLARMKALEWFVEVYAVGPMWTDLLEPLRKSGVKLLIAHLGEPDVRLGLGQPGLQALCRLGRETDAVVKLSAPFRTAAHSSPYPDVEPFVAAIVDAFGLDRCVWGSDWPFIDTAHQVDYGDLLRLVARWLPNPVDQERVLWHNPARFFGFTESG
jgi:predicted TIM-barrel fold metal-dependent hydrolase